MKNIPALSIIIPAYNEEASIADVISGVQETLKEIEHEIIVVNDGSRDKTAELADSGGARVIHHKTNKGYGASIKSGIRHALHEWIAIIDGDGQHNPRDLLRVAEPLKEEYDCVIGVRDQRSFQYASRTFGKKVLRKLARFLLGDCPEDLNSGLRIFRKKDAVNYFPILPNGFSLSTTMTLAMVKDAYEIGTIPIQTAPRKGRRSTVSTKDAFQTMLLIIRVATLFNPLKIFMPVSLGLVFLGTLYGGFNLFREFNIPDGAIFLILTGVIVFFFGILADQLSSLRRGG